MAVKVRRIHEEETTHLGRVTRHDVRAASSVYSGTSAARAAIEEFGHGAQK